METTKNKLSNYNTQFFNKLSAYIDNKLYFFGSVQRDDYFPNYSDIDVDIFSYNIDSLKSKLVTFLGVSSQNFRKFIYRLHKSDNIVTGYTLNYSEPENNLFVEFSIYDEKYKDKVLLEHNSKADLPYYVICLLIILKTFYYIIPIIPKDIYISIKKNVINYIVEGEDAEFVHIDS